jgi:hypothetical protein
MSEPKKQPIQIYLRDDQEKALRSVAERRGESLAALVRAGVDLFLESLPPEEDPLLDIVGLFDSGVTDLAENHDAYLVALIEKENQDEP